ncbi:MAG TPA: hypothetical protein VI504_04100 [Candidatus Eisenbacteria bacterium]|jgi:hypothetical protein
MTGLVRKATLLTAAGLLIASVAMAGVPSPGNSTVPSCIKLVGSKVGVPDPHGTFSIIVRDLANNPLNGASVVVDLSNCPDLRLCGDQLDAGATVNCPAKTTRKFTDVTGTVTFTVLGSSKAGVAANELQNAGRVFANGTLIKSPTVSAFDLDGGSGVGINDLSVWLVDFGTPTNPPFGRSDFDCSGGVGINDLSQWLQEFGFSTSIASCSINCN